MTLRTRITLIVTISFALLVGGITYSAFVREQVLADRFAASRVRAQQSLWQQVVGREALGLIRRLDMLEAAPDLAVYAATGDRAALPRQIQPIAARLRAEGVSLIEVVDPTGGLLYSTAGTASIEGRAVTEAGELARASETRLTQTAVLRDHDGRLLVAIIHPLFNDDTYAGSVIFGRPVTSVLSAIKDETGIDVFISDLRGGLLEGTAPDLWEGIAPGLVAAGMNGVFDLESGEHVFGIVARTLSSVGGNRLAVHVTAEDVSVIHGRLAMVRELSTGGSIFFGVALLLGLSVYMGRSFRPLQDAIEGLDALSHGDMSVEIEGGREGDEVGRVAEAVGIFRDKLRREHRRADGRDRRRRRQQRFIRQQMLSLAETLDEDARAEVLQDLERIERNEGDAAGDSLPLAFDVMVRRVRDQHGRLDSLVGRLQEALQAKTELAGLQQQMEAAGKMQLSMLPSPLPPRDDLDVVGALHQADEFDGAFFDYVTLAGDRLAVLFGQVHGQGLPAAFITHTTRALLRAALLEGTTPDATLNAVNGLLVDDGMENIVVHAHVAVFDPASGQLTYAVAGTLPVMLLRRIGDVTRVPPPAEALPLGVEAGVVYAARTIDLPRNGTLVFCSTGIETAMAGAGAGDAGLPATLRVVDDLTPGPLTAGLIVTARRALGDATTQDLACLAVRYTGNPAKP